jgi:segregation and condensation protein B
MATLDEQPEQLDAVVSEEEIEAASIDEAVASGEASDDGAPMDDPAAADEVSPSPLDVDMALEALFFVSRAPLTLAALGGIVGCEPPILKEALGRLAERYAEGRSGIVLAEIGGAYQLRSAESQKARVRELLGIKPQRLTRAAMETLSLVAYRQPVTRPEIEAVRGVDCGAVLRALLERGMVRILGKKEEPGRPLLYGTTREFLALFGLSSLSALPTLREFRELSEENRSLVERETAGEPPSSSLAELADASLSSRLEDLDTEGENALADLEAAMDEAEARSRLVMPVTEQPDEVEAPAADADSAASHPTAEQALSKDEASA